MGIDNTNKEKSEAGNNVLHLRDLNDINYMVGQLGCIDVEPVELFYDGCANILISNIPME